MRKSGIIAGCLLGMIFLSGSAWANKSAISIEAPASVEKGTEVTIKLTVSHKGNSFMHYTQWLKVDVDGKTVARFDYSSSNRPESEVFTKEVKLKALDKMEVTAEAACNIHGSAGSAKATVAVNK
jgi:desulfoferrodoxin (superoxide reductase-like protein)